MTNLDKPTVDGFGKEWAAFDQSGVAEAELRAIFEAYFRIFPWSALPDGAVGFDAGCGTGRWARFVAPRVGHLHCVDASSEALGVARDNLHELPNCSFHLASINDMPLNEADADFGYSLGVLHHLPDTASGLAACARKLKPGAPFLVYLYYALDDRPTWFKLIWHVSNGLRRLISILPFVVRRPIAEVIAALVYWPLGRAARIIERLGADVADWPLSTYRDKSFYTMRTDALDRFGTRLERRFSRAEIETMMHAAGLDRIEFSDTAPFWCAVGYRKA